MKHFSRLNTRKSETPKEWLTTCSHIGELVNAWSERNDVVVYAGSDAGMGQAVACFLHDTAEMEINLPQAFGVATTPRMVGDLRERENQYEFPAVVGVVFHEALHAKYSTWIGDNLMELIPNSKVKDAFWLLEESRIESKGARTMPENALFLRASSTTLSFAGVEEYLDTMSKTEAFANLAGLTLARVDAGVLDEFDVADIESKIASELGADTLDKLRAIWCEFQSLNARVPADIKRGVELAIEWVKVVDERAIERGETPSEPQEITCGFPSDSDSDSEGSGSGGELPQEVKDLLDEIAKTMDDIATETNDKLADQEQKEQDAKVVKGRQSESKRQAENRDKANKVFSTSSGASGGGSRSTLIETRKPQSEERVGAVRVAQMLEKAKYRERSITKVDSVVPAGKLRTKALVQKLAMESRGVRSELPTWRHKTRKHNDEPPLTIGVMVDISSSMSSAMKPMASIAWILSEAGKRVQAKSAMVYFGSGVFPTLKVGQRLDEVNVYSAPDGTEEFDLGYKALDGTLNLVAGQGVRLLVVVSDGHYRSDQESAVKRAVSECERNGVAVLWIVPKECYSGGADRLLDGTQATLTTITDTASIADAIGKSAVIALERITKLSV